MKIKFIVSCAVLSLSTYSMALSINPDVQTPKSVWGDSPAKELVQKQRRAPNQFQPLRTKAVRGKLRPPADLIPSTEGFRSINFKIVPSPDDKDGQVSEYSYGIGGIDPSHPQYPYEITGLFVTWDISAPIYTYSLGLLNELCDAQGLPRLKVGDKIKFSAQANASSGLSEEHSDFLVKEFVIDNPPVGKADGKLSYSFGNLPESPEWEASEKLEASAFLDKMLPVIRDIYGPPIHSYNVQLTKDKNKGNSNTFFSGDNQIAMLYFYPQLTAHEFVHAMRDYSTLSTNKNWKYDEELTGFEEGFAQAISYIAMNKYLDLYPKDPIWGDYTGDWRYYSSRRNFSYDFDNTDILTTTDYWSAGSGDGTALGFRRYEMGAMAIYKIIMEDPEFPKHFNELYYSRLNSNSEYYPTRDKIIDLIAETLTKYGKNGAKIEGRSVQKWINRQRIFDCKINAGFKIHYKNSYYPSWAGSYFLGDVYYYETYNNGSEWSNWAGGKWQYHRLNGAVGYSKLMDWTGKVIDKKITKTIPEKQPDPLIDPKVEDTMVMGCYKLDITTIPFEDYQKWPGGERDNYIQTKSYGLYTLEHHLEHYNGLPVTSREYLLSGEEMADFGGVMGAVIDDDFNVGVNVDYKNGQIFFKHSEFTNEEGPFEVKNGVFLAKTQWTNTDYPQKVLKKAIPGRVKIRFVNSKTNEESIEYRNVDYGDRNGSFAFLFREKDMLDKNGNEKDSVSATEEDELLPNLDLKQNYPNPFNPTTTIAFTLSKDSKIDLTIFNAKGEEVKKLASDNFKAGTHSVVFEGSNLNSGLYFYQIQANGVVKNRKMLLIK